jgi:hypothetical protein
MARMKDLYLDIYEAVERGELNFQQIAAKFGVSIADVNTVWEDLLLEYEDACRLDRDRPIEADDSWYDLEY